jgi:hypothetical protein
LEAAQRFLEAKERYPVDSVHWAHAAAVAFSMLMQGACAEVAKPEWWNDEGLKALSARVVRAMWKPAGCGASCWAGALVLRKRGLDRQRSSGRRLHTSIGLRRCTLPRRRKPTSSIARTGAAAGRQRPCTSNMHSRWHVDPCLLVL